ncbi:MAG: radical SAM protein [Lentisphaeria bacterium]|nr:radical SAM protein [Lentisphaeria bacterium]
MTKNLVFGPIASRRLGRSLGVDLLMKKICCQDCVYCEAGKTETLTLRRDRYVPPADVMDQLDAVLSRNPEPDFVTFSGSGEPTLSTDIGQIISFLKDRYPRCRVCVLTNGMLLGDAQVRRDVERADLIIPSLDASCEEEFLRINRPAAGITFAQFTRGLVEFTREFRGQVWLEIFIIPGVNDTESSLKRFAELVRPMRLDRIQLNSLDRPGTEKDVSVSTEEAAQRFIAALSGSAPVEFIRRFRASDAPPSTAEKRLLELLKRGPLPREAVGRELDLSDFETDLLVKKLAFSGSVRLRRIGGVPCVVPGE